MGKIMEVAESKGIFRCVEYYDGGCKRVKHFLPIEGETAEPFFVGESTVTVAVNTPSGPSPHTLPASFKIDLPGDATVRDAFRCFDASLTAMLDQRFGKEEVKVPNGKG